MLRILICVRFRYYISVLFISRADINQRSPISGHRESGNRIHEISMKIANSYVYTVPESPRSFLRVPPVARSAEQPGEIAIEAVNFRILTPIAGGSSSIVCIKIDGHTCARRVHVWMPYTRADEGAGAAGSCRRQESLREVVIWSNRFRFLCRFLFSIRHPAALLPPSRCPFVKKDTSSFPSSFPSCSFRFLDLLRFPR